MGLLSLEDADRLLTSSALRTPALRIARDGSVLPEKRFTRHATIAGQQLSGLVDPAKALALFREGATIVFQGLHRYHQPLADLVAELELELGHPCQANAYLTPPGSQGFAVHSDTHDVFVFQTAGTKDWEITTSRDAGPTVEAITMAPGLSLYLPTGTPHAARTQQTVSLHVTIGINQLTWRGLLRRTVEGVLPPDEHLPAGYLEEPAVLQTGLARRLRELADRIEAVDAQQAAEAEVRRFLTARTPRFAGGLLDAVTEIADDTALRRRPGRPCVLREVDGDRLEVLLGDRVLTLPAFTRPALEQIRAAARFAPAELGLDEQSRLVLCRRLVREGMLEVAR
ncbi:cupin domain-containing protein [Nocardioides sp. BP30]|uniref:JmjC domain-containing protein n=1 Tax=Nocardioides sp. BP30 TaxID=3036374 RepID=UPI0024691AB1|nr:cupin domain-containing protein [Nocardioides sp. BP30]WGL52291.1 cupin domain-containing protein [Nocardioides sp. BP30]